MSNPDRPSFTETVAKIYKDYFGKHGVFGIAVDEPTQKIQLFIARNQWQAFEGSIRNDIVRDARDYNLRFVFESPERVLSSPPKHAQR